MSLTKVLSKICPKYRPLPKLNGGRKFIVGLTILDRCTSMESVYSPSILPSVISPWLMMPPSKDKHWFYCLAEQSFLGVVKPSFIGDDSQLVGSSHGWVTSFNRRANDLVLYNPLMNGSAVDLPRIDRTLPGDYCVSKVILSQSPLGKSSEKLCVVMRYGPRDELAFFYPNSSNKEWTPIGAGNYESFVFGKDGHIFCLRRNGQFEAWDLQNPKSPRLQFMRDIDVPAHSIHLEHCKKLSFLVFDPFSGCLYLVIRIDIVLGQGEYKTFGFRVYKLDHRDQFTLMDGTLDGLSFFIGKNHSFMIRASMFPELLTPDSIYFAEVDELISDNYSEKVQNIGIFDYANKSFLPSSFPSVKSCSECAMWFTPTED